MLGGLLAILGSGVSSASHWGMVSAGGAVPALAPALAPALGAVGPAPPPPEGDSPASGSGVLAGPPAPPPRARRRRFSGFWWAYQVALDTILEPLCPPSEHTKQEHGYFSPAMPAAGRGKGAGRGGRCGLVQEVTGGMHPGGVRVDSSHEQSSRSPKGTLLYSTGREIGPINAQDHAADSRRQWKLRLASGPYRSRSRLEALQGFQAPDFSAPATGFRKAFQRDHERRPVNCCVSLPAPSTRPVLVRARGRGAVGRGHRAPRERSLRARPPLPQPTIWAWRGGVGARGCRARRAGAPE